MREVGFVRVGCYCLVRRPLFFSLARNYLADPLTSDASFLSRFFRCTRERDLLTQIRLMSDQSVTQWIEALKHGRQKDQRVAANDLWSRYVARLIRVAQIQLRSGSRRVADEEDVVVTAFESFLRGVEQGRFHHLKDRNDLWQILVMLTERKAVDQRRAYSAKKRGNAQVRGESVFAEGEAHASHQAFAGFVDLNPSPEFAAQATEELARLLAILENDELRRIAVLKMEGYTNQEIANQLTKSISSIERKLALIREIWVAANR